MNLFASYVSFCYSPSHCHTPTDRFAQTQTQTQTLAHAFIHIFASWGESLLSTVNGLQTARTFLWTSQLTERAAELPVATKKKCNVMLPVKNNSVKDLKAVPLSKDLQISTKRLLVGSDALWKMYQYSLNPLRIVRPFVALQCETL